MSASATVRQIVITPSAVVNVAGQYSAMSVTKESANQAQASSYAAGQSAASALASQQAAAVSASQAQNYAEALTATSVTPLDIGTGPRTLAVQASRQFVVGQWVVVADAADPGNFMSGPVTAYSGASLTVNVQAASGVGTFSYWNVSLSGAQGPPGTFPTQPDQTLLGNNSGTTSVPSALTVPQAKALLGYTSSDVGLGSVTDDAQLKASQLDTDGTLSAGSDASVPSQKAVKTYADTKLSPTGNGASLTGITAAQVGLGNVTNNAQVKRTEMAQPNGVATLDATGNVPANQLGNTTSAGSNLYLAQTYAGLIY